LETDGSPDNVFPDGRTDFRTHGCTDLGSDHQLADDRLADGGAADECSDRLADAGTNE
jgi:hypothetical protein